MDLSIVVPTYHEAKNLRQLVSRITAALAKHEISHEIIIVDDNSQDGTTEIVDELAAASMPVRCHVRTADKGLSKSVLCGFKQAKGDVLVCMDADLSHPPESLPDLIAPLRREDDPADFVIGSRYVPGGSVSEGWSLLRWINSLAATVLSWPVHHGQVKDPMAGFFAVPAKIFQRAATVDPIGWKIGLELLVKCRCTKIEEVPIHFDTRTEGESKLNLKHQLEYLLHLHKLYKFCYPRTLLTAKILILLAVLSMVAAIIGLARR